MTQTDLYRFIAGHNLGVLSTLSVSKQPQSALVGIAVTPDLEIMFDTVKRSRKYPNLIADPACSFVIGWSGEATVQYEGAARELAGTELDHYQPIYFEKWPECRSHLSWPGIVYFLVRPVWIRFSDYDQKPPLILEFTFKP